MDTISTREFRLSRGEYRRLLRRIMLRRSAVLMLLVWSIVAYLAFGSENIDSGIAFWLALGGSAPLLLAALGGTLWILVLAPWRISTSRYSLPVYRAHRYLFDDGGITQEADDGSRTTRPYGAVIAVDLTPEWLLLQQDCGLYFVIPRLAFDDEQAVAEVASRCSPEHGARTEDEDPPGPVTASPVTGLGASLKANLAAGLRLAGFRPVRSDDFVGAPDQVLLLALVAIGVAIAVGYLGVDGPAEFSSYALLEYCANYLLLLIGAYLVARRYSRVQALVPLLVVLLSADPLFELVGGALDSWSGGDVAWTLWLVFLSVFLWMMAVWWRAVRIVFRMDPARTSAATGILCAVVVLPQFLLPRSDYWYPTDTGYAEPDYDRVNVEDVFYAQPRLVADALESLHPGRPGVVDLYHIGFGSYAHQKVFRREVNHVREMMDRRFDTRDRSLMLINDARTATDAPIASGTNLELALHGVAERMDRDEDVLFLYLTSHGSKHAELSVSFWPLNLNPLSAGGLRRMLDEAGIRWRVVVISACYSGSFIDALEDDHTLVITAADKDRTSFGCSNENEYTYFGEAYFKHALTDTVSFVEAYEIARQWVTRREIGEGREPSLPAMHLGEAIESHLRLLEQRLATLEPPETSAHPPPGHAPVGG
jgi:hypothetical protein